MVPQMVLQCTRKAVSSRCVPTRSFAATVYVDNHGGNRGFGSAWDPPCLLPLHRLAHGVCTNTRGCFCADFATACCNKDLRWSRMCIKRCVVACDALAVQDDMEEDTHVAPPKGGCTLKFEVQIYRVRTHTYLIDVQKLSGHLYLFLDLCADLIGRLHVESPASSRASASENGVEA
jgi:Kinase associated domain 1